MPRHEIHINRALRYADCIGSRVSMRASNRYYARALDCVRRHLIRRVADADVWADFEDAIKLSMSLSYEAGARELQRVYAKRGIGLSTDREIRMLVRDLPARQKRAINELYGKIARSATNSTRARVRDRMIASVREYAAGERKGYAKKLRIIATQQRSELDTIIRTQNAIAFNAAIWHESQDADDLWGWELTTAGDERVRASHAEMDGVRYPKNHPFWKKYFPPNGWRCRCTPNPIYIGDPEAFIVPFNGYPDVSLEFRFNPGSLLKGILRAA